MYIRRFAPADADAVVRVSELATRITSGAVYDAAFVEEMVAQQDRAYFLRRGEQMHFYVACEDDGTVIGCAAFGPYHKTRLRAASIPSLCCRRSRSAAWAARSLRRSSAIRCFCARRAS